jgi:hypothetical protein
MNNDRRGKNNGFEFINGTGICNCEDGRCNDYGRTPTNKVSPYFADAVWSIMDSAGNLLLSKHEKYGPKNISGAPGGPENGLRVRMWDKMARLNNLIENPDVDPGDESLNDTLIDLLNYCAIFIMVRDGKWPSE